MGLLVWIVNIYRREVQNGQTGDDLIKLKLFFLLRPEQCPETLKFRPTEHGFINFFKTFLHNDETVIKLTPLSKIFPEKNDHCK